jgi:hypothetical protein
MGLPDTDPAGLVRAIALVEAMIRRDYEWLIVLQHEADQADQAGWLLALCARAFPAACGGDDEALRWLDRFAEHITRELGGDPGDVVPDS